MRALRSQNGRLFFGGQGISLIGTRMTQLVASWWIYQLTDEPLLLGLVAFTDEIPSFFLAPLTGVLVEQWNRHHLLLLTQILSMLQSLALAFLALTGHNNIGYIIFLSLFQGCINAFDVPTRQVFIAEIVKDKEDLGNAIALNSLIISLARFLGYGLGGTLNAILGTGFCFLVDGLSYIAIVASLLAIKIESKKPSVKPCHPWQRFIEGFTYAFSFPPIRAILLLLALVSFLGMPYASVLAITFAKDILHFESDLFGFMLASAGLGSLTGSIYLSSRRSLLGIEKIVFLSTACLGMSLIFFSQSPNLLCSALTLFIIGFCLLLQVASSNTLLQTIVEDDKRGRIMSLFTIAFIGMIPFGNLFAGLLVSKVGIQNTLIVNGVVCLLGALVFSKQISYLRNVAKKCRFSSSK